MYSEINQCNDEDDIEFYSHPELPNILLWDADVINFVINRLFHLHWDLDQGEPGDVVAAGLLAGVSCIRDEGISAEDRIRGVFNAIWVAADWMINTYPEEWLVEAGAKDGRWPGGEVALQLWDATCQFGNDGFKFGRRMPGSEAKLVLKPSGGAYELNVIRQLLDASTGHPAHQHLAAALALLEEHPMKRHRPFEETSMMWGSASEEVAA